MNLTESLARFLSNDSAAFLTCPLNTKTQKTNSWCTFYLSPSPSTLSWRTRGDLCCHTWTENAEVNGKKKRHEEQDLFALVYFGQTDKTVHEVSARLQLCTSERNQNGRPWAAKSNFPELVMIVEKVSPLIKNIPKIPEAPKKPFFVFRARSFVR